MKVLLLNPPYRVKVNNKYERFFVRAGSRWPYSEYKRISEPSIYRPFPFFLAYTASLLIKNGYKVEVIDGVALQYTKEEFLEKVLSKSVDVVVIEIAPFSINEDIELAKMLKSKNSFVITIAVGPFVPLLIEYIKEKNGFDYAVNGEYEFAVLEVVEFLKIEKEVKVKGVSNLKNEHLDSSYTGLIEPLDSLPFPSREIFPSNECSKIDEYWDVFCQLRPAVQMHTSRGCPYRCYFCLWNQVMYREGKYRTFSVKRVVDEMELIVKKFNAKEIYIDDDDFTINKNRVREICDEIMKRGLKLKWSFMGDAINLDEKLISRLSESGCIGIKFGVESANKEVLKTLGKPVNLEKVKDMVKWCKKYGIRTHATFTFGLYNETIGSLNETLEFAKKLDTDSVQFSIATPYPGTRFYNELISTNRINNFDWMNYDGSCRCVISYPGLSSDEIENIFKSAFKKWLICKFINPFWVLRQVKFLLRTIFSQRLKYNYIFIKRVVNKIGS